jgi:hypothetical protein
LFRGLPSRRLKNTFFQQEAQDWERGGSDAALGCEEQNSESLKTDVSIQSGVAAAALQKYERIDFR